jgi:RHS repeat-associated protein
VHSAGIAGSYGVGRLGKIVDGSGTTLFSYDHRGNLLVKRQAIGSTTAANLTYAYDLADRVTKITYPSGRVVNYARDTKGRVTGVTTQKTSTAAVATLASGIAYEAFGPLKSLTYGNGLVFLRDWGGDERLYSQSVKTAGGVARSSLTWAYDNDDNVLSVTDGVDATRSVSWSYDNRDRLVRSDGNLGGTTKRLDYVYDANGNRVRVEARDTVAQASPTSTVPYTRTTGTNRIAAVGSATIAYDARGNTSGETRSGGVTVATTYDAYARLTGYSRTGDPVQSHVYNGMDDRVRATGGADVRNYLYDAGGRLLGDYGTSATDVKGEFIWLQPEAANDNSYTSGDGTGGWMPLAVATGPSATVAIQYLTGDRLGKPFLTTDATGAIMTAATPYAKLQYPGQFATLADVHYNRYRDYDPTTGRYIQADPIGLAGGENPYLYAEGNALRFTDPSGRFVPLVVIGGAIAWGLFDAALDYGIQRYVEGKRIECVDWWSVGASGALGAISGSFGAVGQIRRAGREFSHWIPERYIRPLTLSGKNPNLAYKPWLDNPFGRAIVNSSLNGNIVTAAFHSVTDNYRYAKGFTKADNLPTAIQQILRLPSWFAGPASAAITAGSEVVR